MVLFVFFFPGDVVVLISAVASPPRFQLSVLQLQNSGEVHPENNSLVLPSKRKPVHACLEFPLAGVPSSGQCGPCTGEARACIWPLIKENNAFFLRINWEDSLQQLYGGNETGGVGGVKQIHTATHAVFPGHWFSVRIFFFFEKVGQCKHAFQFFTSASTGTKLQQAGAGTRVFKRLLCRTWMNPVDL